MVGSGWQWAESVEGFAGSAEEVAGSVRVLVGSGRVVAGLGQGRAVSGGELAGSEGVAAVGWVEQEWELVLGETAAGAEVPAPASD